MIGTASARARANIALVKYWGKRDKALNLPAAGSLSMTLSSLATTTRVTFDSTMTRDEMILNGNPAPGDAGLRTSRFLDLVRGLSGRAHDEFALVETRNNFPTASGLASSASGFAALALAATRAAGLDLDLAGLAALARRGSGSAPRSLLGGFVELRPGEASDGSDCLPMQLAPPDHWNLSMLVAMNGSARKEVGSTDGMESTRSGSPYYESWLKTVPLDLAAAREALAGRDFTTLGRVTEASCFRMHAVAMAADPPILFWNGVTVNVVRKVWKLREQGLEAYVTIDAGPHVKVLVRPEDAEQASREIAEVQGVDEVVAQGPGSGAEVFP